MSEQKMKDMWGDEIVVTPEGYAGCVSVRFTEGGKACDMDLTPKKARKFAKRLKRAAAAVEASR